MYINTHPPPLLTVNAPAELSIAARRAESLPLKLEAFQIIRATVAEGGLEKVILNVNRRQLAARTKIPLKSGQKLKLQVVSTHPQFRLRIMEETELKHLFRALPALGQNFDISALLKKILDENQREPGIFPETLRNELAETSSLLQMDTGKFTGKFLSALLGRLGLNMEALLAEAETRKAKESLKSALLVLMENFRSAGKRSEGAEKILELLELFQVCRHRLGQKNISFVPLPFPFLEQGYLLAEKRENREEKSDDDRHEARKMTLNLKLSFLGNLQVILLYEKSELRMRVLCDTEEIKAIFKESLEKLKENLSTVHLKSFSVTTGAEEPAAFLVRLLAPGGENFMEAKA